MLRSLRSVSLLLVLLAAPTLAVAAPSPAQGTVAQRLVFKAIHGPAYLALRAAGVKVIGRERVPKEGAVLLAPNHPSYLDPPLVGIAQPRARPHFMAMAELFRSRPVGALLRFFGAYPVDRKNPSPETFAHTEQLLTDGAPVMIFPEGGIRNGEASVFQKGELKRGVGAFSAKSGAPIVPVLVSGTAELYERLSHPFRRRTATTAAPRGPPKIVFGEPIYPPMHLAPEERAAFQTEQLKLSLKSLAAEHAPHLLDAN